MQVLIDGNVAYAAHGDTINTVGDLNGRLDRAIARFGVRLMLQLDPLAMAEGVPDCVACDRHRRTSNAAQHL